MTNREPGKAGGFGQNPQGQEHGDRGLPDQNAPKATERNSNYMKASDAAGQNPPVCTKRDHRAKDRIALEVLSICATPAILVVCALVNADQTALLSLVVVLASLGVFFATYESSSPRLRDIMPTVVLAALAAAGRSPVRAHPGFQAGKRNSHHSRRGIRPEKRVHGGRIGRTGIELLLRPRSMDPMADVRMGPRRLRGGFAGGNPRKSP